MGEDSDEPEFTKEQELLKENYKKFSGYAISNLYNYDQSPSTDEIINLTIFLKENRDMIEEPLYDTCRDYYNEGCKSTQIGLLINFMLSGIFGAAIGLLFSFFVFIPFYGIYALIAAIICLGLVIAYSFYKKYRSRA